MTPQRNPFRRTIRATAMPHNYTSQKREGMTHFMMRQPPKVKIGAVVGFLAALAVVVPWLTPYVTAPSQVLEIKDTQEAMQTSEQAWRVNRAARDTKEDDFQQQVLNSLNRQDASLQIIQATLSRNRITNATSPDWPTISVGTEAAAKTVN